MFLEKIVIDLMDVNCYIFGDDKTKEIAIIDPGGNTDLIIEKIGENNLKVIAIINTHGHIDHIAGNEIMKDYFNAPLLIHKKDSMMIKSIHENLSAFFEPSFVSPPADRLLDDNDIISIGSINLKVIHTPGHTQGSICLNFENIIFTGDTLFAGGIGRTDLSGGSEKDLMESINKKLLVFPDDTLIYPGHGPSSKIGIEKKHS